MPLQTMYAATKAALMMLTLSLRAEYWDENIKFSPATPGTTATGIWRTDDGIDVTPETAQSPADSASHILDGAAENKRVICGDNGDESGLRTNLNPDLMKEVDEYFTNIAKDRKSGVYSI